MTGSLADQAADAISAIADSLRGFRVVPESNGGRLESTYPYSLGFGYAGIALFFAYLYLSKREEEAASTAKAFLHASLEGVSTSVMPLDLFRGSSGIGWMFEHLNEAIWPLEKSDDTYDELDQALGDWYSNRNVETEFLEGLGGVCLYALERLPDPRASRMLDEIVSALDSQAESRPEGIAWRLPARIASLLNNHDSLGVQLPKTPLKGGLYKLNVAHGVTGIAGALAAAYKNGANPLRSRALVDGGSSWVLAQRDLRFGAKSFPHVVGMNLPAVTTGWCNGDIGIATVLFNIAQVMGLSDCAEMAIDVAGMEAEKQVEDIEPENQNNYTLCHGSAGRGHIFNRLYQETREERFKSAACYWFSQTLRLRVLGQGSGGFLVDEPSNGGCKDSKGFLMGAAGLGLALLAATSDVPPAWDRILLLSFR